MHCCLFIWWVNPTFREHKKPTECNLIVTEISANHKLLSTSQWIGYLVPIVFARTGSTSAEQNDKQREANTYKPIRATCKSLKLNILESSIENSCTSFFSVSKFWHLELFWWDLLCYLTLRTCRGVPVKNKLAKARKTRTWPGTLGLKNVWAG